MANEKVDGRELNWRSLFPWTELFRGFQVALDLNKLLLAAAGIVVMSFGWWLLSSVFGAAYSNKPDWGETYVNEAKGDRLKAWDNFRRDRDQWNLMEEAAHVSPRPEYVEVEDIAKTPDELEAVRKVDKPNESRAVRLLLIRPLFEDKENKNSFDAAQYRVYEERLGVRKVAGTLSTMPWSEDRGPNPFLLATGQVGKPWETGHFVDWFLSHQLLVVLEPLVKFVRPLVYFFSPHADGFVPRLYFFLVFAWMVLTWSFFGGAITRIAAVQIARGEKIGLMDAVNFTVKRIVSYLTAPLFPIGFVLVLIVFAMIFGLVQLIPIVGDFVSGLLWVIPIVLGLLIAVTLVGLVVGWPLMSPTISAEGTDSWEAVSRSFSYVFQKPFHYLWYAIVTLVYGAILIFFVGFMGSFAVYMSKWAVSQTPFSTMWNRDPAYLMVYAPQSFGWRTLLLQGAKVDGEPVVKNGQIDPETLARYKSSDDTVHKEWQWHWWNTCGAVLMSLWLGLVFLLVVGFGYSFFWTAITIIYMLMRKAADGAELDEVYLEDDETDGVFGGSVPAPAPAAVPATKPTQPMTMVEPPALRPSPVTASVPAATTLIAPAVTEPPPEPLTSLPPATTPNDGAESAPPSE